MPSTYTLNNGIELIATGEQSGTWGDTTNTNFQLLDTSLDGQVTVTLASTGSSGSPNTLPVSDGAASNGRNRLVIFDDSSDLGGTAFVQLTPNDAEKIIYVRNSLSGSRSILLFQGTYNASNDYEVPAGTTAVVFFNGAGSGAVAANVFNNAHFDNLNIAGDVTIGDDLSLNSDGAIINIGADNDLQITHSGSAGTITNATGDLTLDVAGDIILDGDGASIRFKDNAVEYAHHYVNSNSYYIRSVISDADMIFQGNDGGVTTTVLTLDMSNAGFASFNNGITLKNELYINNADASATAGYLYNDSNNFVIRSYTQDKDIIFKGNDGGSVITALTLDMSAEGNATFQSATTARISLQKTGSDKANIFFDTSNGLQFDNSSYNYPIKFDGSSFVFNEQSNDSDFRVESNNNANMLFVDAGADHVNIGIGSDRGGVLNVYGTGTPIAVIESEADGTVLSLRTTDTDANAGPNLELYRNATGAASDNLGSIIVKGTDASAQDQVYFSIGTQISAAGNGVEASTVYFQNAVAGALRERITISSSALVINQEGLDNDFRVESDNNANMLFVDAGSDHVSIGTGEDRGGVLNVESSDNNYTVMLSCTDDDNNAGPWLGFERRTGSAADNDTIGSIAFLGRNSAAEQTSYCEIRNVTTDVTDGTEDGQMQFNVISGGSFRNFLHLTGSAQSVFNEDSHDIDFRVESNLTSHMLYVDAGNDAVIIGDNNRSTSDSGLSVVGTVIDNISIQYKGTSGGHHSKLNFVDKRDQVNAIVQNNLINDGAGTAGAHLEFDTAVSGTLSQRLKLGGGTTHEAVFNEDGLDYDFRVESDDNTHMLFVDASNSVICVGTSDTSVAGNTGSARGVNINHGYIEAAMYQDVVMYLNRMNNDGVILDFKQDGNTEGTVSVSGSTVSYNGFAGRHESSGIPTTTARGTVVSTIDELDVYLSGNKQGQTRADHAKVEVSNSVGDPCVYGVVDDFTDDGSVNVTSVGIAPVRVTGSCAKGDLLESNGDGTAKVQSDDIIRSKTIGKVTIGNSDTGVKLVSCVMYCG